MIDRPILLVAEGKNDFLVIDILLRRWAESSGYSLGAIETKCVKDLKDRSLQKKVRLALNLHPQHRIVFVSDQDGVEGRWDELNRGRESEPHRCVVGVAVEMLEAWLLVDPNAWRTVFPKALSLKLPNSPEDLRPGPSSPQYTKAVFEQKLRECGADPKDRGYFIAELAKNLDLTLLRTTCPKGFGRLWDALTHAWGGLCT